MAKPKPDPVSSVRAEDVARERAFAAGTLPESDRRKDGDDPDHVDIDGDDPDHVDIDDPLEPYVVKSPIDRFEGLIDDPRFVAAVERLRAMLHDRRVMAIATDSNGKDRIYCSDGAVYRMVSEPHHTVLKFERVGQIPVDQVES